MPILTNHRLEKRHPRLKKLVDERKTELRPKIIRRLQAEMQIKTPALPGKFVLPPYVIEPPDILLLTPFRLVPHPVRVSTAGHRLHQCRRDSAQFSDRW